ncbi:MAG: primosomal protein N', partial [Thermoflexales bacterium]|nr:primosomal protein N' [Thermoflexales bacterium]
VPPELQASLKVGCVVAVPLRNRVTTGVVVALLEHASVSPETLKPIRALLDPEPALDAARLALAQWIAETYAAPLGRCCALMIPPGLTAKTTWAYAVAEAAPRLQEETPEARVLAILAARGPLLESKLSRALRGIPGWREVLRRLIQRRYVLRQSVLHTPLPAPQRTTLVQLAISEATLELVRDQLAQNQRLAPKTRERREAALRYLLDQGGLAWADWMMAECGLERADLAWLAERGYVILGDAERWRDPLADIDYVPRLPPPLTSDQERVWKVIQMAISTRGAAPARFLLRGVTGSGKTEIYLRAVEAVVKQGKGAIVLVPEISLTPQTARRFLERFPGRVALIHSRLKPGERYDTWRRIRSGELLVVVGARSALFAPLPQVGLIVLDEEHDPAYKHSAAPFYDARRVALKYAELTRAGVIFGSATPSLEAWHWARQGRLRLLELPNRVRSHLYRAGDQAARLGIPLALQPEGEVVAYQPLPEVQVIDMRAELRGGNLSMFSGALRVALDETLRRGEQAILFLNRRGEASAVLCRDCGYVVRCPDDDLPLTVHLDEDQRVLKCHQCDRVEPVPSRCPSCGSQRIRYIGIGTQKVEQAVQVLFPAARIVRWDRDAAGRYGAEAMLKRFVNHQADVLIGTQMIAKGLDLPLVTLVGVVLADVGLFLPDFRTSERVFSLIEQVAGRAGRSLLPGRVIVQTYNPDHPAIQFAQRHDVRGFAAHELAQRRQQRLPPFTRLVRFECADEDDSKAQAACQAVAQQVVHLLGQDAVIGPARPYFSRRNRRFRWQVLARVAQPADLLRRLRLPEGCLVDVDPVSVL